MMTAPLLQTLIDRQNIMELSWRFSRACDRLDRELMASVYWPDGTDDHGAFRGPVPAFVDWVMEFLSAWQSSHHDNSNFLIEFDGDDAFGEVHWAGYYSYEIDGQLHDQVSVGRYLDHYERRNGEWRILHRTMLSEWLRVEPSHNNFRTTPPRSLNIGRRGPSDLVYRLRDIAVTSTAEV